MHQLHSACRKSDVFSEWILWSHFCERRWGHTCMKLLIVFGPYVLSIVVQNGTVLCYNYGTSNCILLLNCRCVIIILKHQSERHEKSWIILCIRWRRLPCLVPSAVNQGERLNGEWEIRFGTPHHLIRWLGRKKEFPCFLARIRNVASRVFSSCCSIMIKHKMQENMI